MLKYTVGRIVLFVPTVLAVLAITWSLGYYGPGDPARIALGQFWTDDRLYRQAREAMGLDKPLWYQYGNFVVRAVQGDLGTSWMRRQGTPVSTLIAETLPVSAQLGLAGLTLLLVLGIPLGILAAVNRNSWVDYLIVSGSVTFYSVPAFVLGPLLMIVLVLWLRLLPSVGLGWHGLFSTETIMPAIVLAAGPMLLLVRQVRAGVIEVQSQDYIRTARAKGLREHTVVSRHVLRNAITPALTVVGLIAGQMLTGSLFVETIFGIPGFGSLTVEALRQKDFPILMGTTVVAALVIIFSNLVVDVLYKVVDPRVAS
jgi:ABC-type dipeptide/oligopeptide/nickel transport system permease component